MCQFTSLLTEHFDLVLRSFFQEYFKIYLFLFGHIPPADLKGLIYNKILQGTACILSQLYPIFITVYTTFHFSALEFSLTPLKSLLQEYNYIVPLPGKILRGL